MFERHVRTVLVKLGENLQENLLGEILFRLSSWKMVADDSDHHWIESLNQFFRSRFVGVTSPGDQLKKFVARHLRSCGRF